VPSPVRALAWRPDASGILLGLADGLLEMDPSTGTLHRIARVPEGAELRIYPEIPTSGQRLEARVRIVAGDAVDVFPDDDVAWALLPRARTPRVLLVTPGNLYVEAPFLLNESIDVDVIRPDAYVATNAGDPSEGYDLTVFDGVTPPTADRGNFLYFAPFGEHSPWRVEADVVDLADAGEIAVYRGEFDKARELLDAALAKTAKQQEMVSERLLLVRERELEAEYIAAKDLELQLRLEDAIVAYVAMEESAAGFRDVPARIEDLRQRVEAATGAYRAGVEAEERGQVDAAIDAFTDVQLFWPGYRDARDRLDALRKQRLEGGGTR
jgi:tetratricopeptide (TPR) repeat protein